ncbi:MAG: MFS transporter [Candidatus Melainabacteria bacterium]|nr:MFS transporter [Candidatus Melainabacteria bacterium]
MTSEVSSPITKPALIPAHEIRSGYSSLFRNKHFMALWIAQIFSQLADRAVFVLFVAILTAQKTSAFAATGAAQMTSILYVAFTIPAVVLSPIAGVYVDRWSNRTILVVSNLARCLFVSLVALPMVTRSPQMAYLLAFLISMGTQFFGPAEAAAIPRLVKRQDLYCANSLFFTTMMIALGFGFAVGEPIISQFGLARAHWAVAASFFVASLLLCFVKDNKLAEGFREPWWEELRFGLSYISSNRLVFRAILKITVLFSTIITLNIIAVGLAQQVLQIEPFQFGYIVAAAGVGMGLGNFGVGHYGQSVRPSVLAYAGFAGLGLFMVLLGSLDFIARYLWPAFGLGLVSWQGSMMAVPLLLAMFVGISCAMVAVPTQAALQSAVPEELRGKVFGAQNTAMSAASTIPVIAAGVLADNLPGGVSTTLLLVGLPTLVLGGYHLQRTSRKGLQAE